MTTRADGGALRRFVNAEAEPARSSVLGETHPAVVEGRTIFPSRVAPDGLRFLVSGHNNSKIGKMVTKGPWAGMPIFTLTLEERATCPRSCSMWRGCYGNALQWPHRWDHRAETFEDDLRAEVITLCRQNPKGVVVRLHVLGDFYSVSYVRMWECLFLRFPQLHIYGYTARREDADDDESRQIAELIRVLTEQHWDQFAIRFSREAAGPGRAIVVDEDPAAADVIMCPAQSHATETCGTCGLCWAEPARGKTIAFLRHGMKRPTRAVRNPVLRVVAARSPVSPHPSMRGRPLVGGLPGETKEGRALRVAAFVRDNPALDTHTIAARLGVPVGVVEAAAGFASSRLKPRREQLKPPQRFTPSVAPARTPEERLAAVPDAIRAEIAARYGATFR